MGILNNLERRASPENPNVSLSDPRTWLNMFAGSSVAGVNVTPENSISSSTVYACIRLLSETIASLPLVLYRREGRNKFRATEHPLYWLMHDEPNQMQSSFQWREMTQARVLLFGNGYSEIEQNNAGRLRALLPLNNYNVEPYIEGNQKFHRLLLQQGGQAVLNDREMFHLSGFGYDGIVGLNPINTNKGSIGLSLAAERFGQKMFENGVRTSGVLEHPGVLSDPAYKNLKKSFDENYAGVENTAKPMILEEGMKWQQMGMNPVDAQIIETRRFQVPDVARIFNVPPHMIGDLERSTNNNIEQQSLEFIMYSIRPWLVRWEQELNRKLLNRQERGQYYFKLVVDALLRGDIKTRFESYKMGREMGIYATNDIRDKEDMNPVAHGDDDYMVPMNMGRADQLGQTGNNGGDND